ncbi:MAG: hypothetical protein LBQ79_14540 [Deltaproteobacteria bacterium]|jgi:hypothetical protein|nr:hypothetical protein [Deltaproteobacteria bacterium]
MLQPLVSAGQFTAFFAVVTLSACFWGRLVLRAFRVRSGIAYGSPLPLCAFLGTLAVVLRHVSAFRTGFEAAYEALFVAGVLGAAGEGALWLIGRLRERASGRGGGKGARRERGSGGEGGAGGAAPASPDPLDGAWPMAASAIAAFVYALYFAIVSPSGRPDPWLSDAMDYYAWIFAADYWRGSVDPARFFISDTGAWFIDAFGQNVSMGFFSSAAGGFSMAAAHLYQIALMAWTASAASLVARGASGLPRTLCLAAALGAGGSPLLLLLITEGNFGHQFALMGFVACLCAVLLPGAGRGARAGFGRALFPVLCLFMGYQAGFPVFMCLTAGAAGLAAVLRARRAGGGPEREGREGAESPAGPGKSVGLIRAGAVSLWPLAAACLAAAVASPQTAAWMAGRLVSSASQLAGVWLGFLDPAIFSGVPHVSVSVLTMTGGGSAFRWTVAGAAFLLVWAVGRRQPGPGRQESERAAAGPGPAGYLTGGACPAESGKGRGCPAESGTGGGGTAEPGTAPGKTRTGGEGDSGAVLDALSAMLALSCAAYLAVFAAFGDSYQLWKFAAMTALPLSFVPPLLAFLCVGRLFRCPLRAFSVSLAAFAALALALLAAAPRPGEGGRPERLWSVLPLIYEMHRAQAEAPGIRRAVFDLSTPSMNMAALTMSERAPERELMAVKGAYFIPDNFGYLDLIGEGTAFFTGRDVSGPYGTDFSRPAGAFRIRRWDPEDFAERGAVEWSGLYPPSGDITRPDVSATVMPPASLRGRDMVLEIRLWQTRGRSDPRCGRVVALVDRPEGSEGPEDTEGGEGGEPAAGTPAGQVLELDVKAVSVPLPAAAFSGGRAVARLGFPGYRERAPWEPAAEPDPGSGVRPTVMAQGRVLGTDPANLMCDYVVEKAFLKAAPDGGGGRDGGGGAGVPGR